MTKRLKKMGWQKGFTLIELMAVLAILAIIVAIAVPAVGSVLAKSEASAEKSSIELMERAGELAHLDGLDFDDEANERYTIPTLVSEGYLKLETDSPFHDSKNYVAKLRNGTFLYNGVAEVVVEPEVIPEPLPDANPASDFIYTISNNASILITNYVGVSKDVIIPQEINGIPVTGIGQKSFSNKALTSVIIPPSVYLIAESAFSYNKLSELVIPNSVTIIKDDAFTDNQLMVITMPASVNSIGVHVFVRNPLTSVTVLHANAVINSGAFKSSHPTVVIRGYDGSTADRYAKTDTLKYTFETIQK